MRARDISFSNPTVAIRADEVDAVVGHGNIDETLTVNASQWRKDATAENILVDRLFGWPIIN